MIEMFKLWEIDLGKIARYEPLTSAIDMSLDDRGLTKVVKDGTNGNGDVTIELMKDKRSEMIIYLNKNKATRIVKVRRRSMSVRTFKEYWTFFPQYLIIHPQYL